VANEQLRLGKFAYPVAHDGLDQRLWSLLAAFGYQVIIDKIQPEAMVEASHFTAQKCCAEDDFIRPALGYRRTPPNGVRDPPSAEVFHRPCRCRLGARPQP
jgi:hypothetical protein